MEGKASDAQWRKIANLQQDNAALRSQVDELAAALEALYQSASILYDTPEAHTTIWAINLKRHKEDLAQARAALARYPGPDRPGQGGGGGEEVGE